MSGQEHSPGQWAAGDGPPEWDDWCVDGPGNFSVVAVGDPHMLVPTALVIVPSLGRGADELLRERAQLLAAAPLLLEALEALVRINVEHNESISAIIRKPLGWKDTYLDQARAAIAKAKGEQP